MKKFVAKVLIYVLIVTIITCCVNFVYIKFDKAEYDTDRFDNIPSSIAICNFGSSHGYYGFNYEDVTNEECFNFALTSQVLSYDRRIFDNYKDHIREGAVVFIPVSYFSLYGTDERTRDGFAEKNKRYYRILPSDLIKEYDLKTDIYVNYFPSLISSVNLIKLLIGKSENTKEEIWSRVSTDIDVKEVAAATYKIHFVENSLDYDGNRVVNKEEVDALKYIVQACQSIGATPVLVTTPFLQEYTDAVKRNDPEFYDEFYSLINAIADEMDVEYYDYGLDERFKNNYSWFMDSDHLNKEGARQFVNILMEEVVHYGSTESLVED